MQTQGAQTVLDFLRRSQKTLSLSEIRSELSPLPAERTLRRWLFGLVQVGLVERSGRGRNTRYRALEKVVSGGPFATRSLELIALIRKPIFERRPVSYSTSWLERYRPNETFYLEEEERSHLWFCGYRSKNEEPAGTYARQIYNRLLIDLSYNSSRLEGNTYSLLETERLLLEGKDAEGKQEEEKVMILNHKEAIRYLVDNADRLEWNAETIGTLHYLLSDALVEPRYAGRIRDQGVRIGGSSYLPLDNPEKLKEQLNHFCATAARIEDPFEQSLFALVHLSYLQAFVDVNKRTARLAANIPFVRQNCVPLSFNALDRSDYMSAVIVCYELHEVQPLKELFILSYLRSCELYDAALQSYGFDEVRVRYRGLRREALRAVVLQGLTGDALERNLEKVSLQVPKEHQHAFLEDLKQDLEYLDVSRLVGLGITKDEFAAWRSKLLLEGIEGS